jgi:Flp pilus assembly protein TadG
MSMANESTHPKPWEQDAGAALLEAAFVLVLLILLLTGFVGFDYVLSDRGVIVSAARNAARTAARLHTQDAAIILQTAIQSARDSLNAGKLNPDHYLIGVRSEDIELTTQGRSVTAITVSIRPSASLPAPSALQPGGYNCLSASFFFEDQLALPAFSGGDSVTCQT